MAFFYEEGEEKKRSGVFMRHVNIGTIAEDEDGNGSYAPSRIFIDPSLTQEGEAAEAKATGDAINALAEQTNQDLDELSEKTETAISDLQDATEEAINSLAAIGVIEDTKSGEVVSISDSAAYKMQGLRLYGKSRQATTTGAQLLDIREEIASYGTSITATTDGTGGVTINGTAGGGGQADIYLVGSWDSSEVLFEEDTYTFSVDGLSADESLYVINNQSAVKQSIGTGSCTVTSQITGLSIRLKAGKTYSNLKIYPMLSASSSAKPWEPYTGGKPSPSPEYPQEIESAGNTGSITLTIANQNFAKNVTYTSAVANFGTLVYVTAFSIMPKVGQTYTLSVDLEAESSTKAYWNRYLGFSSDLSFAVNPGKARYSRTITFTKEFQNNIALTKSSTSDGVNITPSNFMLTPASVTDVQFVESQSQTLTYPTPNGLPGIPVESGGNYTDAEGQQWICDEVDFGRGKYVQRVKKISNVTFNASGISSPVTESTLYQSSPLNLGVSEYPKALCDGMQYSRSILQNNITGFYVYDDTIRARFSSSKDNEANIAKLAVYTWLVQCSSIETDLSPEQLAAYAALTTYKPNTTVTTDSSPAAGVSVDYVADPKAYIDNKFSALEALQAQVDALIGADSGT